MKLEMGVRIYFELSYLSPCRVRKEPCVVVKPSDTTTELRSCRLPRGRTNSRQQEKRLGRDRGKKVTENDKDRILTRRSALTVLLNRLIGTACRITPRAVIWSATLADS